jgi:hypothetical protein
MKKTELLKQREKNFELNSENKKLSGLICEANKKLAKDSKKLKDMEEQLDFFRNELKIEKEEYLELRIEKELLEKTIIKLVKKI